MTNYEWLGLQNTVGICKWFNEEHISWIPIEKNQPFDDMEVLVCTKHGEVKIAAHRLIGLMQRHYVWEMDYGCLKDSDVIAWMSLPAPYKH